MTRMLIVFLFFIAICAGIMMVQMGGRYPWI
ncbi:hypothetical protein EDC52_105120 [Biostraticola tofi]|uniref:Uncharacterized protein n=1 Tax=Biostraticola tofi TaxID=466109 RepID=A0A4R3YUQ9_9GAMM|nr:hypothetical protein EDC52_105120 [Biostraticola tofi]